MVGNIMNSNPTNLMDPFHPYLHNTAAHFRWQGGLQLRQYQRNKVAIQKLLEWEQKCIVKEQAFLADFNVKSFHEWEEKYLIHTSNSQVGTDIYEVVLKTINSREMYGILNSFKPEVKDFANFLEARFKGDAPAIIEKIINEPSFSDAVGKFIVEGLGSLSKDKRTAQTDSLTNLLGISMKPTWKGILKSYKSEYLRDVKRLVKLSLAQDNKVVDNAVGFLRDKLNEFYRTQSKKKNQKIIDYYCNEWRRVLTEESESRNRLLSFDESNVIGEIEEAGELIVLRARVSIDPKLRDKNITITPKGKNKIQRFTGEVESKTDLEVLTQNGKYNIQQKNSFSNIYSDFENSVYKNAEQHIFGGVTLQGEIKFPLLMQYLAKVRNSGLSAFSGDDAAALAYLIVNIGVLNKFQSQGEKFYKSSTQNPNNQANTEISQSMVKMVDDILAQNIGLYVSDILNEGTDQLTLEPYDFIIFKSRKIIPMSAILDCLIATIEEENNKIFDIHVSFDVDSSVGSVYRQMIKEKSEYLPKLQPGQQWYSDSGFVSIGQRAGLIALQNTKINKIRLNLRYKQTFNVKAQNLIGKIY